MTLVPLGLLGLLFGGVAVADVPFEIPRYEEPADNAFTHYQAAFDALPAHRLWDDLVDHLGPGPDPDAEVALTEGREALDELRGGLGKPCVMPTVESFDTPLPYLGDARSMVRLLMVEGWLRAESRDFPGAFQSHLDALTLGQDVARNGALIHKLVSVACEGVACKHLRALVGRRQAPEPALADLVSRLAAFEAREVPLSETFALEYAWGTRALADLGKSPEAAKGLQEAVGAPLTSEMVKRTQANLERLYTELVADAKIDYRLHAEKQYAVPRDDPLTAIVLPEMPVLFRKTAVHSADLRGTLLVAALELHRVRCRQYAATLEELVPGELKELPLDPFSGREYRYERVGPTAYKLYSVGPNLQDDGGTPPTATAGKIDGDLLFSDAAPAPG